MQTMKLFAVIYFTLYFKLDITATIITDEIRLHKDLFKGDRIVLPVLDGAERKVRVQIGLTLNQVVDVVCIKILFDQLGGHGQRRMGA